jgi:hypothetical protein
MGIQSGGRLVAIQCHLFVRTVCDGVPGPQRRNGHFMFIQSQYIGFNGSPALFLRMRVEETGSEYNAGSIHRIDYAFNAEHDQSASRVSRVFSDLRKSSECALNGIFLRRHLKRSPVFTPKWRMENTAVTGRPRQQQAARSSQPL